MEILYLLAGIMSVIDYIIGAVFFFKEQYKQAIYFMLMAIWMLLLGETLNP